LTIGKRLPTANRSSMAVCKNLAPTYHTPSIISIRASKEVAEGCVELLMATGVSVLFG